MTAKVITRGAVVGQRYKLTDLLGTTVMAQVWKAVDHTGGGTVAVKFMVLTDEMTNRSDATEIKKELGGRFRQEAALLGEFDHPGIPRFHSTGSYRGVPYFVMDFIDGTSLQELHGGFRPLPLVAIAAITVQAAEALRYAHSRPVVHRDLKPSNIMIANSGVLKVIDFGIAKNLAAGAVGHTRPGVTLGSTGYQAPEQIGGLPTSSATDVYALGCVLYELFALNPPFPDTEPAAVQRKHLQDEPCSLLVSSHRVTAEIDDMILRMLAKDPKQRPDLTEVLAVFEPHLPKPGDPAPVPTLDPDPTIPYRCPDQCQEVLVEARPAAPKVASAGRRTTSAWLSVREMSAACDSAELELASGARGPGVDRLAALAPQARKDMGSSKPVVLRAFRLLAEAEEMRAEQGKQE